MKNKKIILFLSFFLVFSSCKKNKDPFYNGYVTAEKNGIAWGAKISGASTSFNKEKFNIGIDKYLDKYIQEENLGFVNIPKKVGVYRAFKNYFVQDTAKFMATFNTNRDDGDVTCDEYSVIESDSINNFIQIDSFNPSTQEVSGKFSLSLLIRLPKCRANAPDTINFRNGVFSTKLFY